MAETPFGMLDLIGSQLEKNRERLGPLYRPLYLLSGALAFLLFFAVMIGLPLYFLEDFQYVAFVQIGLIAVYFMLQLSIRQNVFDRFVFSGVLFVVLAAAPVLVMGQGYFRLLTENAGGELAATLHLPKTQFFLYSILRGVGNTTWAIPLLFADFTFFPQLKAVADRKRILRTSIIAAWVLQGVACAILLWRDAVFQRFSASTAGARPVLAESIHAVQWGYLIFTLLTFLLGFATLVVARRWGGTDERRLLLVLVSGMLAVQIAYLLAAYNVQRLNLLYPAARTTAGTVAAYRSEATGQVVFTSSFFRDVSPSELGAFQPVSVCRNPEAQKFTFEILKTEEFRQGYREVSLPELRASHPAELFCQREPAG